MTGFLAGFGTSVTASVAMYKRLVCPESPSNLIGHWKDSQVILKWDASPKANTYEVYYKPKSHKTTEWFSVPMIRTNTRSLNIINGFVYDIYVVAENSFGSSPNSHVISGSSRAPPPTNLTVSYECTSDFITLKWTSVVNGKGYVVKRSTILPNDTFSTVRTLNNPSITITEDSSFTFGVKYCYIVISLDHAGESSCSNEASIYLRVPAPKNVVASLVSGQTSFVSLQWIRVPKAEGYIVKRATDSLAAIFSTIRILDDPLVKQIDDTSFKFGVTYYYTVTSIDKAGQSEESPFVTFFHRVPAPANLAATYDSTHEFINLQWTPMMNGKGYIVKRATNSSDGLFSIIKKINDPSITKAEDTTIVFGTKYYYTVTSVDEVGESNQSEPAAVLCPRAPAPVDLTASYKESTNNSIIVQWKPVTNGKGYIVKRTINSSGSKILGR
jgi:fibronectin type 3 domain-containing protein